MEKVKTIFEKLNLEYSTENFHQKENLTHLQYINNPDGSVRWIWPSQLQKPLFLKFFSNSSIRSKIIVFLIEMIFLFRIQNLIFKRIKVSLKPKDDLSPVNLFNKNWALFTGTAGPNRKAIIYKESGINKSFVKIALNTRSNLLLKNEESALVRLSKMEIKSFVFPQLLGVDKNTLELSDISKGGKRSNDFSELHLHAIREMNNYSSLSIPLSVLPFWKQAKSILENLLAEKDSRIPNGLLRKLFQVLKSVDDTKVIETGYSHGDFTPWNMYKKNGKLHIYDWELHQLLMPLGFDAFHFIIQKGILIEKKSWTKIEAEINQKFDTKTLKNLSEKSDPDVELYLKLYLILNTIYYLDIFSQQDKWHEQIHWLLKTWNEAISKLLVNTEKNRSLILMDTFDFLLQKPYAAIKFPDSFPEQLSKFSDVDLCLDQSLADSLNSYLKNHPLALKSKVINKSYMSVLKLVCNDGSLLSLDLIWKFKRKATVLMDLQPLIQSGSLNDYQVKVSDPKDLARFIGLFYISNNAMVPEKYLKIAASLKNSEILIDQEIYQSTKDQEGSNTTLKKIITEQKANKGFQKIKNTFLYLIDSIKEMIYNPGMIITFSGVDGAGKSTVIEKVKYNLEKQLRRRVVVIRHRPSILPILSVWSKGKIIAENEATIRLPRQGKNTNVLSSLLRFFYYYSDYLFGQFVVYFKYVLRGYVVLYDRYYFDFINDSKRSNIQLPSYLTKFGYHFLLKPELNFFLYADPELILSRKKELDSKTIEQLTKKYQFLFEQLNKKDLNNRYISIENIDLKITLDAILNRVNRQAA
ncbi:MAG: thymidylate kinase [Saprospiraceae bacterium]|jgi:thymidylate kinase